MHDGLTKEERAAARAAGLGRHLPDTKAVAGALAAIREEIEDAERRRTELLRAGKALGLTDQTLGEMSGLSRYKVKRRLSEGE